MVLKKTEVFDLEGVMSRTDMVMQLQGQVEQLGEKVKDLEGDLQTRERENYHLKQKAELEKFKADLDKVSTQQKGAGKLFEKRLDDVMGQVKGAVKDAEKPAK